MIDLDDLRRRPWCQSIWQDQLGLSKLVGDEIVGAIDSAQRIWPGLVEGSPAHEVYKAGEIRVLLTWTPADRLAGMFKTFEAVIRAGNATDFGQLLSRSPHRFDARVVSILSERARLQNVRV